MSLLHSCRALVGSSVLPLTSFRSKQLYIVLSYGLSIYMTTTSGPALPGILKDLNLNATAAAVGHHTSWCSPPPPVPVVMLSVLASTMVCCFVVSRASHPAARTRF